MRGGRARREQLRLPPCPDTRADARSARSRRCSLAHEEGADEEGECANGCVTYCTGACDCPEMPEGVE